MEMGIALGSRKLLSLKPFSSAVWFVVNFISGTDVNTPIARLNKAARVLAAIVAVAENG